LDLLSDCNNPFFSCYGWVAVLHRAKDRETVDLAQITKQDEDLKMRQTKGLTRWVIGFVAVVVALLLPTMALAGDGDIPAAMEFVNLILDNKEAVIGGLVQIVGGFALIAAAFPSFKAGKGGKVLTVISKVVDFLGANFGKAKNDPRDQVKLE